MSARWRPAIFLVLPGSLPPYRSPALSIFVNGGWIDHLSTLRELFHDDKSSTSKLINYCNRYLLCLVQVRERCSLSGLVTSQRVTNQPLRNSSHQGRPVPTPRFGRSEMKWAAICPSAPPTVSGFDRHRVPLVTMSVPCRSMEATPSTVSGRGGTAPARHVPPPSAPRRRCNVRRQVPSRSMQ